jgi:cytochrome c oxidase subunit 2
MSDTPNAHANPTTYGLGRWLVGGLVGGAIVLALLVGAYRVGYDRGSKADGASTTAPPATTTTATTTGSTASAIGPVQATPELVAQGKQLWSTESCVGCHSTGTTAGAGPGVGGLAGSKVELDDGTTVTADDAYLVRAIAHPDVEIVKGYKAGMMSAAVASFALDTKPDDLRALVAYVKSLK